MTLALSVSDGNYSGRKEAMCAHKVWVHSRATRQGDRSRPRHMHRAPPTSSAHNARADAHAKQRTVWSRDVIRDPIPCHGLCDSMGGGQVISCGSAGTGQAEVAGCGTWKIGTTGSLMLVGSGLGRCSRDGLAAPLRMFYHMTVRLQRNKFYLLYIYTVVPRNKVPTVYQEINVP